MNFKRFSQSQGQLFLTVGQNNFGNKIPDLSNSTWLSVSGSNWIYNYFTECIVGDITPHDGVSEEDKHSQEMNAMTILVKNLPTGRVSLEFFNAFERYVFSILMFLLYFWILLVNCKSIRYIFNFCLMHFEILFLDINVIILNIGRFYNIELQIEMYSGYFLWSIKILTFCVRIKL